MVGPSGLKAVAEFAGFALLEAAIVSWFGPWSALVAGLLFLCYAFDWDEATCRVVRLSIWQFYLFGLLLLGIVASVEYTKKEPPLSTAVTTAVKDAIRESAPAPRAPNRADGAVSLECKSDDDQTGDAQVWAFLIENRMSADRSALVRGPMSIMLGDSLSLKCDLRSFNTNPLTDLVLTGSVVSYQAERVRSNAVTKGPVIEDRKWRLAVPSVVETGGAPFVFYISHSGRTYVDIRIDSMLTARSVGSTTLVNVRIEQPGVVNGVISIGPSIITP
jgi:hypothetical protein